MYPLLEQVDLPVKQREVQERQGERKQSQQETGNLASPSDHWKAIPFVWWFDGETASLVAVIVMTANVRVRVLLSSLETAVCMNHSHS